MEEKLYKLLKQVNVLNRDNGKRFTKTDRLDVINEILWNSQYRKINADGLFQLYAKCPLSELPDELIIVSSHVDCEISITKCFTEDVNEEEIKGTFDNALTNAAILSLMEKGNLPSSVLMAFTGDEEEDSKGADDVARFIRRNKLKANIIVLDVTDMGWKENCVFTVENNFWNKKWKEKVIQEALSTNQVWRFVPENPRRIPNQIPAEFVIFKEAEPDESWEYDEKDIHCFSLCIPVLGEMHSNEGVLTKKKSFMEYVKFLERLLNIL